MHNFIVETKKSQTRAAIVSLKDKKERKSKFNFKTLHKSNEIKKLIMMTVHKNIVSSPLRILLSFHIFPHFVCSVQTDLVENGANSTLSIAKVRKTDGGNYTCSISPNDYHTINIQVINGKNGIHRHAFCVLQMIFISINLIYFPGESLAELYHGSAVCSQHKLTIQNWIGLFVSTIIVLSRYINVSDAFKVLTIDERRFIK